jgi:hypothetical protein
MVGAFGGAATTGDAVGDAILGVAGMIVAVIAVLGILFLILRAANLGFGGSN